VVMSDIEPDIKHNTKHATKHVYEISVTGRVPVELLDELGAETAVSAPSDTMLVTDRIGQAELQLLVAHIADLGLTLREVRRVPWSDAASGRDG
jgi:hypothetical protein